MRNWLRRGPRIYYLAPDWDRPSWGVGLIYAHVRMLREHGHGARLVHVDRPFRPSWIEVGAPIHYLTSRRFRPRRRDVLVVPEVLASSGTVARKICRKLLFAQGTFLLLARRENALPYSQLGFEGGLTILPHLRWILQRYFELDAQVVSPFVAPYFYRREDDPPRRREVLIYPKAGCQDIDIVRKLLLRELPSRGWELVELDGMAHDEVARRMRAASFYVCVNDREAFNTTVPEAMAAGCVPFCYEAYGGRDFLRDGENARVFGTHDVYELIDALLDTLDHQEDRQKKIEELRRGATEAAAQFSEERTERELLAYFDGVLEGRA